MTPAVTKELFIRFVLLALASAAPNAFPLSQMGYGSLHQLALAMILPAVAGLLIAWALLASLGPRPLATLLVRGALAGLIATLALEAVRYPGFLLGFMPGNLPRLLGVLLLDRFALGPSTLSDLAGFSYHAWNGASFGIVFVMLAMGRSPWWAVPYGLALGLGFLASPVVEALGVGPFGRDFGWHFAATVLTAHAAFGAALAVLVRRPMQWRQFVAKETRSAGRAWSRGGRRVVKKALVRPTRPTAASGSRSGTAASPRSTTLR